MMQRVDGSRRRLIAAAIVLVGFVPQTMLAQTVQSQWLKAAELIQPDDLKAELYFLASDDLGGRSMSSIGDQVATDYIASEFMRLGLKPVGDNDTYFQSMDVNTAEVDRTRTKLTAKIEGVEHNFTYNEDFHWSRQSLHPMTGCGGVVFVGYGIDAPEYGYNDFADSDVKGKVALVLGREPQANDAASKWMGTLDTYHSFYWEKIEQLRKRGAAGVLLITDRVPRDVRVIPATSPRYSGGPSWALSGEMWDVPVFTIGRKVADQFLAASGKNADALQAEIDATGKPNSFEVSNSSACLTKAFNNLQTSKGRNVVGLLEGSDPKLKTQTIVVTAHHDHMGTANGHIYHGADDNGSGVAGLIGIARAMVKGNIRPKRSVLFIAYDGEERIFLGSYFYVTHPIVPLKDTVATLNMDMIGRNEKDPNWPTPTDGNVNMVNILGTRYNPGLRAIIDRENQHEGLKLDYKMDVMDWDSLWSRSDHFWFATLHIPQVEFQTGLHPDYHTDNDTWDRINYPKLTKIIRLGFMTVADLADSGKEIPWVAAGAPLPSSTAGIGDGKASGRR
jgi:Zn-dependent M28 family amino/carboxypeptidase